MADVTHVTGKNIAQGDADTMNWLLGWIVVLGIFYLMAQSRLGYTILYYMLVLLVVFLAVTQSNWIAASIHATGMPVPGQK